MASKPRRVVKKAVRKRVAAKETVRAKKPAPASRAGAIYGIGVDLLRQERMDRAWQRHGQRLPKKILCEEEMLEFARARRPARYLAMAFAAKEAFVKALGIGFHGVGYRDAGHVHEPSGKPVLVYGKAMRERLRKSGIGPGHVTLTDEGGMICAMVVLERA